MTSASLDNVDRILVQHQEDHITARVSGMQVIHHDGLTETLGRFWDAEGCRGTPTKEVYKAGDGQLREIRFVFSIRCPYDDVEIEVAEWMDFVDKPIFTTASRYGIAALSEPIEPGMVCRALDTTYPQSRG